MKSSHNNGGKTDYWDIPEGTETLIEEKELGEVVQWLLRSR